MFGAHFQNAPTVSVTFGPGLPALSRVHMYDDVTNNASPSKYAIFSNVTAFDPAIPLLKVRGLQKTANNAIPTYLPWPGGSETIFTC